MTFAEFIKQQSALDQAYSAAAARLKQWDGERLANGLTPDNVKALPEWQNAKRALDQAFSALRAFNGRYAKQFETETKQLISLKRRAMLNESKVAIFNLNPYSPQFTAQSWFEGCETCRDYVTTFNFSSEVQP